MKYKFEQLDVGGPEHLETADQVAGWSIERVSMKLYTPEGSDTLITDEG